MPTVQQEILDAFFERLRDSDSFSEEIVKRLRELFQEQRKPKAEELAQVMSDLPEEPLP